MFVTEPGFYILSPDNIWSTGKWELYRAIERAARTCYKSESEMTNESAAKMVEKLVENGHEAMLEHAVIAVKFFLDRGLSHELVRHREASYAQESTRYCNYSKGKFDSQCTFISPYDEVEAQQAAKDVDNTAEIMKEWTKACHDSEEHYLRMLELGATPELARSVLNNSLKTEIVVTANAREWRHIFKMRAVNTYGKPHPQMKALMHPLLERFAEAMPELFGDILENEKKEGENHT